MTALQLFTNALEQATGKLFISAITVEPLLLPAYKEFTISLYEVGAGPEKKLVKAKKMRVTDNDEKQIAIDNLTQELMAEVLNEIMQPRGI